MVFVISVALKSVSTPTRAQPLVEIDMVLVNEPGNAPDANGVGGVSYEFKIGRYEVTIGEYASFLNAAAKSDPYGLYTTEMTLSIIAGISRVGSPGSYSYSVIGPMGVKPSGASSPDRRPIAYISYFDAMRFCNWLHNGARTNSSTETGAYFLNGSTTDVPAKNPGAKFWIPSEDEWHKAAYYKRGSTNAGYWLFPTQRDTVPSNSLEFREFAFDRANYKAGVFCVTQQGGSFQTNQNYLTDVGAFPLSFSPYGTFDQGGNVFEWVDNPLGRFRRLRGGSYTFDDSRLRSTNRTFSLEATNGYFYFGFRVAGLASNTIIPPRIVSATRTNGRFSISWSPAAHAHVQRRVSLTGGSWSTVVSNVTTGTYTDSQPASGSAFYRLILP